MGRPNQKSAQIPTSDSRMTLGHKLVELKQLKYSTQLVAKKDILTLYKESKL